MYRKITFSLKKIMERILLYSNIHFKKEYNNLKLKKSWIKSKMSQKLKTQRNPKMILGVRKELTPAYI